jgi:glycosyltransferase involved in cell wall biosynthesis
MTPSVALVHDYLTQRGGAERTVLSMLKAFPGAPLYTSLYLPAATFPEFATADVRTLPLNRIGLFRRYHRLALPLYAPAFSALRVEADVAVCSTSGWAHGVRTTGRKIVYCHVPARWLYEPDRYLGTRRVARRAVLAAMRPLLVRWDRRAALEADRYVATSTIVRDRIRAAYGIEATILPPPLAVDTQGEQRAMPVEPGFFLAASRLVLLKKVDAIVAAFRLLPDERLVVAGTGPERGGLESDAPPNVLFAGEADDAQMRWLYANCEALVCASDEGFGLTPAEANAFGKPTLVLREGGFLDTIVEGESGLFFDEPEPHAIATTVRAFRSTTWSMERVARNAARFDERSFVRGLRQLVADVLAG